MSEFACKVRELPYTRESDGDNYFSVFAITETVRIRSFRGVKYPLEGYEMHPSFPIGVSNEILDEFAFLEIESGIGAYNTIMNQ